MKRILVFLVIAIFSAVWNNAVAAEIEDYSSTINIFRQSPATQKYFDNSYGYAVFPTIGKAGYIIGGSYGIGQVYTAGKVTGKSTVIEGSIGFQFGGKAFSEMIFFEDKRAYDEFTGGNFELGATAQAIVITAGAEAQAGTTGASAGASAGPKSDVQAETGYFKGVITFVHAQGGLMYELSIGGQKFTFEPVQ